MMTGTTKNELNLAETRREKIDVIVRKPYWRGMLDLDGVDERIVAGDFTVAHFTALDELLDYLSRQPDQSSAVADMEKATSTWSVDKMTGARRAMWFLFEGHPLIRDLDVVRSKRSVKTRRKIKMRKPRKFSVYPEELPEEMQEALENMSNSAPGEAGTVPVPSMVMTTRNKVCELAKAAQNANIAVEMSIEAAIAYERSLVRREKPLSPKTILSAIRQVRDFARYIGADQEVMEHFAARIRVHERKRSGFTPQKEAKVLALPDYAGIFGMALDMLGKAANTRHPKGAQGLRNGAVAITLFCPFPFRVADTKLHFGREILWDESGYRFNLIVSKTQRPFHAPVIPVFGWFIDQLILQGSGPEHLDDLRSACFASKRALFVNYNDTEPHEGYVSYVWDRWLGTGNHAARTKLHDSFGHMGARGVELAMRACGHRSEKTAEAYRTRAYEYLALERIHRDQAADILDEEWEEFFGKPALLGEIPLSNRIS